MREAQHGERERRAKVVRVDFSRPPEPIEIEEHYDDAFVVATWGDTVIGEAFVPAQVALTPAKLLREVSRRLLPELTRQALRASLTTALVGDREDISPPTVSVVVCTRDRPVELSACLESVLSLRTTPVEILVIDNASRTGETEDVCRRLGIRCIREPIPGQSRARNRGIAETVGDVIAFTDDDCIVDPAWLDDLGRSLKDPLVAAVTGYVGPLELETQAQWLFERHGGFGGHPGRRVFHSETDPPFEAGPSAGNGANMIVRREAIARVGPFAEDLGPGTPARSSDDKELFCRLLTRGFRIAHEPNRWVWHRHRRDEAGLRRIMRDYGVSEFAYTSRLLVRERELGAVRIWRWWLRHYARELPRTLLGRSAMPPFIPLEEIRGALSGPLAMLRSARSRRTVEPVTPPRPAQQTRRVEVTREHPDVTVAIASRNRRDPLRHTLLSLAEQEHRGSRFEVVTVLDGSTDGSADMARGLDVPYELRVVEQPPHGLARARNRGANEAANPVVIFLDDDIEPRPGFVAAHASAHGRSRDEHVVVGPFPPASAQRNASEMAVHVWWQDHFRRKAAPGHRMTYIDFVDGNSSTPTALFARFGGFDEGFPGGRRQDWELGLRMLKAGVRLEFEPQAAGLHHIVTTVGGSLRNARQEGHNDVLIASRHPETLAHLPLEWGWKQICTGTRRFHAMRRMLSTPRGVDRVAAALERLDAARMREAWRRLSKAAVMAQYANGICDALPDPKEREAFFAPLLDRRDVATVEVALEHPAPFDLPPAGGALDVTLTWHGQPLATVPATRPAQQWDAEDLVERLADAAAPSLALAAAQHALG